MPIITAFQGSILVEGSTRDNNQTQSFYKHEVTCYGSTIGELLDNLVAASVTIANDLFAWTATNKSEDYKFSDDYWYMHIAQPRTSWSPVSVTLRVMIKTVEAGALSTALSTLSASQLLSVTFKFNRPHLGFYCKQQENPQPLLIRQLSLTAKSPKLLHSAKWLSADLPELSWT